MTGPRLATVLLLGASLGLATVACSDGGDRSDAAEPSTSTTVATTTTTVPEADVRVLDPGTEPRRELRYRFAEGSSTLATFTTDLELEQERDGVRQRLDAPPVRQTLAHRVTSVDGDGTATVGSEVVALEVQAEGTGLTAAEVDELQRQLDPLASGTATVELGVRGEVRAFDPARADEGDPAEGAGPGAATGADDDLVGAVLGLAPVLPEQPLGVGGRWEVTTEVELGGRAATVQRTYALTAVDDAGFSWALELAIEGAGTFTGEASGTNRWDAPVGELTARLEGQRWLDPETLESVATPGTEPDPGPTTAAGPRPIRQELVLAYRASVAPVGGSASAATPTTAPAGQVGGT